MGSHSQLLATKMSGKIESKQGMCPARLDSGTHCSTSGYCITVLGRTKGSNVGLISQGGVSGKGAPEKEYFSGGKY